MAGNTQRNTTGSAGDAERSFMDDIRELKQALKSIIERAVRESDDEENDPDARVRQEGYAPSRMSMMRSLPYPRRFQLVLER